MEAVSGVTVMDAAVGVVNTANVAGLLITDPLAAVIIVPPSECPVAKPVLLILTTVGSLDVQVKVASGIGLLLASLAVNCSC